MKPAIQIRGDNLMMEVRFRGWPTGGHQTAKL